MGGSTLQNGRGGRHMLINDWQRTLPPWTQRERLAEHRDRGWKAEERRPPGVVGLREAEAREHSHGEKSACRLPSGTT